MPDKEWEKRKNYTKEQLFEEIQKLKSRAQALIFDPNDPASQREYAEHGFKNVRMESLSSEAKDLLYELKSMEALYNDKRRVETLNTIPEEKLKTNKEQAAQDFLASSGRKANYLHDDTKYLNKFMLEEMSAEYAETLKDLKKSVPAADKKMAENISKLEKIVKNLGEYAKIDTVTKFYKKELNFFKEVFDGLKELNIEEQYMHREGNDSAFNTIYKMATSLYNFFDIYRNGTLDFPENGKVTIDTTGRSFKWDPWYGLPVNNKDNPLFVHEPSFRDIQQGARGDCFLVSSLSAIAMTNPDLIRGCMRENSDNTVTVRFWQRKMTDGKRDNHDEYVPVYVKVDKVTPSLGSADNSCWVQTLERAYAASGLYQSSEGSGLSLEAIKYSKPTPPQDELDALYEKYSKMDKSDLPNHYECPWLIDRNGDLHKYSLSYKSIEGGSSGVFIEHLLGPGYPSNPIRIDIDNSYKDFNTVTENYANILSDMFLDLCNNQVVKDLKDKVIYTEEDHLDKIDDITHADVSGFNIYEEIYKHVCNDPKAMIPYHIDQNTGHKIFEFNSSDEAFVTGILAGDIFNFYSKIADQANSKNRKKTDFSGFDTIIPLENDKNAFFRKKINDNPKLKSEYERVKNQFVSKCNALAERYREHKEYDGKYNGRELELKKRIEAALHNEKPVTFGTNEAAGGDSTEINGMNCQHAYAVTEVVTKEHNGHPLYFLKFRNPHGDGGRQYKTDENGKMIPYAVSNTNGEGLIELSDAFKELGEVCINEEVKRKYPEPVITEPLSKDTISHYTRALETCLDSLNSAKSFIFSKDSKEFVNLKKQLDTSISKINAMEGKNFTCLQRELKRVERLSDAYLKHCNDMPIDNSTRKARENANAAVKFICSCAKERIRVTNPKDAIYDLFSDKLATGIVKNAYKNGEIKKMPSLLKISDSAFELLDSDAFKKEYGNKNICQLQKLVDSPKNELAAKFKNAVLGVAMTEENVQKDVEIEPVKVEKDVPEKKTEQMKLGHM